MGAGKYPEACPKLRASQKLDPAIGTLLKLGFCFTYTGQTASAWASFNDAEALARKTGDKSRANEAAKRARDLEGKLSKLVIESAAPDVEVRRDGRRSIQASSGRRSRSIPGRTRSPRARPGKSPGAARSPLRPARGRRRCACRRWRPPRW